MKTVIAAFLKSYTTPTSILQAEAAEIEVAINSLGMQVWIYTLLLVVPFMYPHVPNLQLRCLHVPPKGR